MVLICTECKHCIAPDKASSHTRQHHPFCKVPEHFVAELNKKYPGLKSEKIHPDGVVQPIFGLAVPTQHYVICARCFRGYSNNTSWRNHVCERPQMDLKGRAPQFSSLVQTFFRGPRVCYFPIVTPVLEKGKGDLDDFARFRSQFPQVDATEDEIAEPADYYESLCNKGSFFVK
jgi:hypothetical protein